MIDFPKKSRRTAIAMVLMACGIGISPITASAEDGYPSKAVTVVVGFPPGSGTDIVARFVAERLSQRLGRPFVVDNRPGGSGGTSAGIVARAKPDGYTLFVSGSAAQVINPHLYQKLPYDSLKDFSPISQIAFLPYLLVVKQDSPYKNLPQLMAAAKKSPDAINYASTGPGSGANLVMSVLLSQAGVQMTHVPYKGSPQIQTDIIGGQVDTTFDTMVSLTTMVKGGRLRALAISTVTRSEILPEVPTAAEQGYPDFDLGVWLGLFGPAKMPASIQATLSREMAAISQEPEARAKLQQLGVQPRTTATPEDFKKIIQHDYDYWGKVIREFKIQAD